MLRDCARSRRTLGGLGDVRDLRQLALFGGRALRMTFQGAILVNGWPNTSGAGDDARCTRRCAGADAGQDAQADAGEDAPSEPGGDASTDASADAPEDARVDASEGGAPPRRAASSPAVAAACVRTRAPARGCAREG